MTLKTPQELVADELKAAEEARLNKEREARELRETIDKIVTHCISSGSFTSNGGRIRFPYTCLAKSQQVFVEHYFAAAGWNCVYDSSVTEKNLLEHYFKITPLEAMK